MSRARNVDDFRKRLRWVTDNYERVMKPHLTAVQERYAGASGNQPIDNRELEAHVRKYFIDGLLWALNWRLDAGPPNPTAPVLIEAQLAPEGQDGAVRFLDYLGVERETLRALLVLEAKRPSLELPTRLDGRRVGPVRALAAGLSGKDIGTGWTERLRTLRDYARRVKTHTGSAPRRVVATNGAWLVVFLDPERTFCADSVEGDAVVERLRVFETREAQDDRADELFQCLEYGRVAGDTRTLAPEEVGFYVSAGDVDRILRGLHVHYHAHPDMDTEPFPSVDVRPVVFLLTKHGGWLRVEREGRATRFRMPDHPDRPTRRIDESDALCAHVADVDEAASALLEDVNRTLGSALVPSTLAEHYADDRAFGHLPGVARLAGRTPGVDEYLLVTGEYPHYLLPHPRVQGCPFHAHAAARAEGLDHGCPVVITPSATDPRTFFADGQRHHCAHGGIAAMKRQSVTPLDRPRTGARSHDDSGPFCEVAPWDTRLCCRTCAYQDVCTAAPAFRLPCGGT